MSAVATSRASSRRGLHSEGGRRGSLPAKRYGLARYATLLDDYNGSQVGPVDRESLYPPLERRRSRDVVRFMGVARAVSDHEVLDRVVRPPGPRHEVVDGRSVGEWTKAVEATTRLEIEEVPPKRSRKPDSFGAEEMSP